jgi:hypothetical protein
MHNI